MTAKNGPGRLSEATEQTAGTRPSHQRRKQLVSSGYGKESPIAFLWTSSLRSDRGKTH